MKKLKTLDPTIFRPGTKHQSKRFFFVLNGGGIGDYLNFLPALQWIDKMNHQVDGHVVAPIQILDVVQFVFRNSRFKVIERNKFFKFKETIMKEGDIEVDPALWQKYITAIGAHLMDLGYMYYCNRANAYEGFNTLPDLTSYKPKRWLWPELDPESNFAIITTGFTAITREMKPQYVNELVNYLISKNVTPVFLGSKDFTKRGEKAFESGYYARFSDEIDFSKGVDLREKTSLLDAAHIISKSKLILGIDNGLLNLAGCTKTPVIYGHTITRVEHRELRRKEGLTIHVTVDEKSLSCSGCQSKMRFIFGHKFRRCIYDDVRCLDYLFDGDCAAWKQAIDKILDA